ncbi:AraC family transcriptional regulator [Sulfurospirillum barnesii]|uniref:DNA-binding domain-containing protein, AraC-type n=1 Tax=Sulfurospirillum barnesii (strain ATCC 700032 / DSM 10660 / SES-3) TaxID=760154 RepID=I3XWS5_SULBS|nr:AraC family transcriptional regulator [Sulfurospirillum barnesii]AFL68399.1 DNA-binding domain-containing protein, AraC-type [Sulfurospirillum barnesii SES-3]
MDEAIEKCRLEVIDVIDRLYPHCNESVQSKIAPLSFYLASSPSEFKSIVYEPSLCLILQGSKAVGFGHEMYHYRENEYLLASTHIPADVKIIEASTQKPYRGLTLTFSLEAIYEVLKRVHPIKLKCEHKSEKGLFFDTLHVKLYEPIARLVKLLERPQEEIDFLSPLIMKEILFTLINDKSGYFLNKFAMEGTTSNKIVKAISEIKNNFNEKLNMVELAKHIDMSESHLYQNFKTITSLSPLQFQKKLRLEEAKKMLSVRKIDISEVAFLVGYESPSQFSREYARMFGMPPKEHLKQLHA